MKKGMRFGIIAAVICLVLECFVFNINVWHLTGKDYTQKELELQNAIISNSGRTYEFLNLDERVGTIALDVINVNGGETKVVIDAADETNSEYRYGIIQGIVLYGYDRTENIVCNLSGKVSKLKINFKTDSADEIIVKKITINRPVGFRFSPVRILMLWSLMMSIYMLINGTFFRKSYEENERPVKIIAWIFTAVLVGLALLITNVYRYADKEHDFFDDWKNAGGNQITKELVEAFEAGQVYLDIDMNETLGELENPYDWSMRTDEIGDYPWDHLLYEGKYYSYYGIAPLLIFLPYHLITGGYFPAVWAIWLFGCIGICFLTAFYLSFMKKFFPKIRTSLLLMGLFIISLSNGIWFTFNKGNFYEIAQNSGFACVTAGAYFLISSNVIGSEKINKIKLAASSVFLSLGVLSRPTLAVYCFVALIFIGAGYVKQKKEGRVISYFLCALLPFVIFGGIQMAYNYLRFDSVMDFGIQYSLTINDFTKTEYHTHFVFIGLWNYLFALPVFNENFPFFIPSSVETFNPNGYYFIATASAVGLFIKALPMWSYLFSSKAYRLSSGKNKKLYAIMITAGCVLAPLIIICSVWESGYGARYCVDFAWQMLMGALIIAFVIWEKAKDNTKRHLNSLMVFAGVVCLVLVSSQTICWILDGTLSESGKMSILNFGRLFEFWK